MSSRSTTTIKNIQRIGETGQVSALVDLTVTRLTGSATVTLDIGPSSNSNMIKRYAIPLAAFLRLAATVDSASGHASIDIS
jgi:hypothetical protein